LPGRAVPGAAARIAKNLWIHCHALAPQILP